MRALIGGRLAAHRCGVLPTPSSTGLLVKSNSPRGIPQLSDFFKLNKIATAEPLHLALGSSTKALLLLGGFLSKILDPNGPNLTEHIFSPSSKGVASGKIHARAVLAVCLSWKLQRHHYGVSIGNAKASLGKKFQDGVQQPGATRNTDVRLQARGHHASVCKRRTIPVPQPSPQTF